MQLFEHIQVGFPRWLSGKRIRLPMQETREILIRSLGQEDPLEQPPPVFLPRESHGQRSPVGYNPWGLKESDTTEQLNNTNYSRIDYKNEKPLLGPPKGRQ